MKVNYQKNLEATLSAVAGAAVKPKLLLHACCAPCSSSVLEYLSAYFEITLFFYNPNIDPPEEYERRLAELRRFCAEAPFAREVTFLEAPYDPERFLSASQGLEHAPEGGPRCQNCFRLRLEHTAMAAQRLGVDYFTTTLSISPHKNAQLLNQIGLELAQAYGVAYLCSDFKKKEGYKRSIALSQAYGLYRQDYCGCRFSQQEALARRCQKPQASANEKA